MLGNRVFSLERWPWKVVALAGFGCLLVMFDRGFMRQLGFVCLIASAIGLLFAHLSSVTNGVWLDATELEAELDDGEVIDLREAETLAISANVRFMWVGMASETALLYFRDSDRWFERKISVIRCSLDFVALFELDHDGAHSMLRAMAPQVAPEWAGYFAAKARDAVQEAPVAQADAAKPPVAKFVQIIPSAGWTAVDPSTFEHIPLIGIGQAANGAMQGLVFQDGLLQPCPSRFVLQSPFPASKMPFACASASPMQT